MPRAARDVSRCLFAPLWLVLLASCASDPDAGRLAPTLPGPDLMLSVSSASGEPGVRVVVALSAPGRDAGAIAGLQGSLWFDPERLEYLGQSVVAGSSIVVTNWAAADRGALRILAIDTLLRRVDPSAFVFRVKADRYVDGLRFQTEGAVATAGRPIARLEPPAGVTEDPSLTVNGTPGRLTVEDWAERLGRSRAAVRVALPGVGTRFGDATLDGQVNILDALATANVAVGNLPLLTDAGKDFAIAANVFPANLPGLGEEADPVPPGREADGSFLINVLDVSVITNESIGNDPPIAGDPIPGRTVPAARAVLQGAIAATKGNIPWYAGWTVGW